MQTWNVFGFVQPVNKKNRKHHNEWHTLDEHTYIHDQFIKLKEITEKKRK